jgi:hypothetical protein
MVYDLLFYSRREREEEEEEKGDIEAASFGCCAES